MKNVGRGGNTEKAATEEPRPAGQASLPSDAPAERAPISAEPPPSDAVIEALFEQAVRTHSRRLLAIARGIVGTRASPEDVLQQAVLNLYQHRRRYDWREPGGLMRRSVVNEALRLLRQPRMSVVADDHPERDSSASPAAGLIEDETVRRVRQAIAQLPEHFRAALVLCEYEELSYIQIAEILDASVPQVKTWLHRGRRQLAQRLEDLRPEGSSREPPE